MAHRLHFAGEGINVSMYSPIHQGHRPSYKHSHGKVTNMWVCELCTKHCAQEFIHFHNKSVNYYHPCTDKETEIERCKTVFSLLHSSSLRKPAFKPNSKVWDKLAQGC